MTAENIAHDWRELGAQLSADNASVLEELERAGGIDLLKLARSFAETNMDVRDYGCRPPD